MSLMPPALLSAVERCIRVEEGLASQPYIAAYVAGSRVDGFGNQSSDIDAYVVTEYSESVSEIHRAVNGVSIEITFLSFGRVNATLTALCAKELDAGTAAGIRVYDALLCDRFLSGKSLFGEPALRDLGAGYSRNVLAANLRKFYQSQAGAAFRDCVGAYREGDHATAALSAPRACAYAFDMYLASRGDTNPLAKWRIKRATKILGGRSDIEAQFRQVSLPLRLEAIRTEEEYVFLAAALFQQLHDLVARSARSRSQSLPICQWRKHPLTYLTIVDDEAFLLSPERGLRVSDRFVDAWLQVPSADAVTAALFAANAASSQSPDAHRAQGQSARAAEILRSAGVPLLSADGVAA